MKRVALSLALLLFILSVTTVQSLEPKDNTISSYGIVNSATHELWWGTSVSNTAWTYDLSRIGNTQINIVKQCGATAIRIMLDKYAWDNIANYKDYVKQLVAWCKPELKVLLDLSRDTSHPSWTDDYGWAAKKQIITTPTLRTAWINWGKAVISHCNPDAIGLMGEPGGGGETTTFDYYYDNFVIPSINAYRSVNPNIVVFVMGMPFWDLTGFVTRPIADSNAIYEYHFYYNYPVVGSASQLAINMANAYGEGRLTEAKNYLTQYFDWKFSGLPKSRINFGELGVYGHETGADYPTDPNWDALMKDTYYYIKQKQLQGLFQYGIGGTHYSMLDPSTSYTTLTPYGELWAQNCPV